MPNFAWRGSQSARPAKAVLRFPKELRIHRQTVSRKHGKQFHEMLIGGWNGALRNEMSFPHWERLSVEEGGLRED